MSYPGPLTVIETIDAIEHNEYLLPAIQREFVWKKSQICYLFDSLMNDYPIGSFLFWEVKSNQYADFEFYKFIKDYHERDLKHNEKAGRPTFDRVIGVLDGQQRLNALYIGLKGSYSERKKKSRRDALNAYETKFLYINLLSKGSEGGSDYKFDFFTEEQVNTKNVESEEYWFKVRDISSFTEESEISSFSIDNFFGRGQASASLASKRLFRLYKIINESKIINYYLEKTDNLEKVLNIFIRANTGGTKLVYSDLLLSVATSQWEHRDAREEITSFVDEINDLGNGFNFTKDFVLRAALVIQDDFESIQFKVGNFNRSNMQTIESNWELITSSIRSAIALIIKFGYQDRYLPQQLPIIPIAHYISKKNPDYSHRLLESSTLRYHDERKDIQNYLVAAMLKLVFSKKPEESLLSTRAIIKEHNDIFPLDRIKDSFTGISNSLYFDDEDIDTLLGYQYKNKHTFSILALFYPHYNYTNNFHIDHIYPESLFKKTMLTRLGITDVVQQNRYRDLCNTIPNLQLLEGEKNLQKSNMMPHAWLMSNQFCDEGQKLAYKERHSIPQEIALTFENFEEFISKRQELLKNEFKRILPDFIRNLESETTTS